jgi:hypothetical protein
MKARLDTPVEGTQITMFIEGGRGRYRELVRGTRKTLQKWCGHSDTDITFEDRSAPESDARGVEPVNAPFEVEADVRVRVEHPGSEISVGFSHAPVYGFYNKGLALAVTRAGHEILEARAERFGHIAFKIKSRYLEHTLSRETVMRDANFDKAMALLDSAIAGPLRVALLDELCALCARPNWTMADRSRYQTVFGYLASEPRETLDGLDAYAALRTVEGDVLTFAEAKDVFDRNGRVYVADAPSSTTRVLAEAGTPVFLGGGVGAGKDAAPEPVSRVLAGFLWQHWRGELTGMARRVVGQDLVAEVESRVVHPERAYVGVRSLDPLPAEVAGLVQDTASTLRAASQRYGSVSPARFEIGAGEPCLLAIGEPRNGLMPRALAGAYDRTWFESPDVVVNVGHPHVRELLELWQVDRGLAAYCLAKAIMLEENRNLEDDPRVAEAALEVVR